MSIIAKDRFRYSADGAISNSQGTVGSITPSNTDELTSVCRIIYCGGSGGNVAMVLLDGSEPGPIAIDAGERIDWLFVRKVKATGTTATGLIGFL